MGNLRHGKREHEPVHSIRPKEVNGQTVSVPVLASMVRNTLARLNAVAITATVSRHIVANLRTQNTRELGKTTDNTAKERFCTRTGKCMLVTLGLVCATAKERTLGPTV